jgi:hypothetical protein
VKSSVAISIQTTYDGGREKDLAPENKREMSLVHRGSEMKKSVFLKAAVFLLVAACGNGKADVPAAGNPDAAAAGRSAEEVAMKQDQVTPDQQHDLAIAFGLPRVVAVNAYLSRYLVVEAVYQATALSGSAYYGRITNTGTLTTASGGVQYLPQPADRLVLLLGQERHEFVVKEAQGNMQAQTATAWLLMPHVLRYTHVLPGQAEVELAVQYDGSNFASEVTGWYQNSGQRYDLRLRASGRSQTQRGVDGQEAGTEYDFTGTISGEGLVINVSEHHFSTLAAANHPSRQLPGQRGSASRFIGTINNTLKSGDTEYRFENVRVQTDMVARGNSGSAGLTGLDGRILRNGQVLGQCVLRDGRAFLAIHSGLIPLDLPVAR